MRQTAANPRTYAWKSGGIGFVIRRAARCRFWLSDCEHLNTFSYAESIRETGHARAAIHCRCAGAWDVRTNVTRAAQCVASGSRWGVRVRQMPRFRSGNAPTPVPGLSPGNRAPLDGETRLPLGAGESRRGQQRLRALPLGAQRAETPAGAMAGSQGEVRPQIGRASCRERG